MEKKDIRLENFKQALISTIKSISEKNDCEVSFGKNESKNKNNVNLPEIKKLDHFYDFLAIRAKAEAEKKKTNKELAEEDAWLQTLENAVSAKKSYMYYRDCLYR